jgi:hypothetical protein
MSILTNNAFRASNWNHLVLVATKLDANVLINVLNDLHFVQVLLKHIKTLQYYRYTKQNSCLPPVTRVMLIK